MKFGTSGLRGLSEDLKGRASALYATAFGRYLLDSNRAVSGDAILIGRDFRDSSPEIAADLPARSQSSASRSSTAAPADTGAGALWPALRAASLMITGSHIPADRNGIKFYRPDGEIDKDDEAAITAAAAELDRAGFALPTAPGRPRIGRQNAWRCSQSAMRSSPLAHWPASRSASTSTAPWRAICWSICSSSSAPRSSPSPARTPSSPSIPKPSPETIALLKQAAKDHGLRCHRLADGDGDRPLVTDETGTPLRGDLLGLIAANFLHAVPS
jgi:phosphomannomutase